MTCFISSPFWNEVLFSVGCAYFELTKCPKEMFSCTTIISAGNNIIWNVSCLPHVRSAPARLYIWLRGLCWRIGSSPTLDTITLCRRSHYKRDKVSRTRARRLIVHENPTQKSPGATRNFTIAWALTAFKSHWYRYIMFIPAFRPTTSVITLEAQLRDRESPT